MKRKLASGGITTEMFKNSMKGIYSTSVTSNTIDESPFAYKDFSEIEEYLKQTVRITNVIKSLVFLVLNCVICIHYQFYYSFKRIILYFCKYRF